MHVVLRLSEAPLTLFQSATGEASEAVGHAIVGGARSGCYVKQAGEAVCSVGVQLQPGGAWALLGVPAGVLAERHTPLDALWGLDVGRLREQLYDVRQRSLMSARQAFGEVGMRAQVDLLESVLLSRLRQADANEYPLQSLTRSLTALERGVPLTTIVDHSCVSHRTFITRFRNMVGLSPKTFARIRRFQRVVHALSEAPLASAKAESRHSNSIQRAVPRLSLAQLALDAGYADQAHLSRDFVEFAGVSPTTYCRLAPAAPNHVQVSL
jgi:AraC-like DNA-binding protein